MGQVQRQDSQKGGATLTSMPTCLGGESCDPETGENGLRGLVRLVELRGLAGLFVLKEPEAKLATVGKRRRGRDQISSLPYTLH